MSKDQQVNNLRGLSEHAGWKVLESRINDQIKSLSTQLESDKDVVVSANQAEIRAYRFILRQVNETRERNNG